MSVKISPELQSLIPPLSREEYAQLETNILGEGCLEPLTIWQEEQVLLDGHNRYAICTQHGLAYTTVEVSMLNLEAAQAWMIAHQLGRRNLTHEQASYLRGKQYALAKNGTRGGGDRRSAEARNQNHQNEGNDTAATMAVVHKVGKATIERDATYAKAIDTLAEALGGDARQTILAREARLTQHHVKTLAAMVGERREAVAAVLETAKAAPTRQAVAAHMAQVLEAIPCGVCGRALTADDSQARGIGPICVGHGSARSSTGGATPSPAPAPLPATPESPSLASLFATASTALQALDTALRALPKDERHAATPDPFRGHLIMMLQLIGFAEGTPAPSNAPRPHPSRARSAKKVPKKATKAKGSQAVHP